MAALGAQQVVLTDLASNLELIRENCSSNSLTLTTVVESLRWGNTEDLATVLDVVATPGVTPPDSTGEYPTESNGQKLRGHLDVIVATDVFYHEEHMPALVATLKALSSSFTEIFLGYGRNRIAIARFLSMARDEFVVKEVESVLLDEMYQCDDVTILHLKRRPLMS